MLERVVNEQTGKLYTNIRVDDVRRIVSFFGGTAGEGGWRVAIVDAVDDLAREGANALLKVLEEPPARTLLLLLSHSPGRELPTIRSRCRRLLLRPLSQDDVVRALAEATGRDAKEPELAQAAAAADGSVSRALALLDGPALALRQRVLDAIGQLPNPDPRALHALADALGGTDPQTLATFMDLVNGWLSQQARRRRGRGPRARARRRGLGQGQPPRARGRCLQSRAQAVRVLGVHRTRHDRPALRRLLRRLSGGGAGVLLQIVERRLELRVFVSADQVVLDRRRKVRMTFLGELLALIAAARLLGLPARSGRLNGGLAGAWPACR